MNEKNYNKSFNVSNEIFNWFPKCEKPIYIHKYNMFVPCGHCFSCISKNKKEYYWRCIAEMLSNKFSYFITLTFDDTHLGKTTYDVFAEFIFKLKRVLPDLSFFVAYENGEKTKRPHFHCLIFSSKDIYAFYYKSTNMNCTINEFIAATFWNRGFVKIEFASEQNIRYCVGYVLKKCDSDYNLKNKIWSKKSAASNRLYFFRVPYFHFSRGLGFKFYDLNISHILEKGYIPYNGYKMPIPRSYFESRDIPKQHHGNEKDIDVNYLKVANLKIGQSKRSLYEVSKKVQQVPF